MIDYKENKKKKENLISFIKETQNIIELGGVESVSIRKIAQRVGLHNSTIYLYFESLNELITMGLIKHFQRYSEALENASKSEEDEYYKFYAIWTCYARECFKNPDVFLTFFFGDNSSNLRDTLNNYYALFPEEKERYGGNVEIMYFGMDYTDRCRKLLEPLLGDERTRVTEETIDIINEISVCFCQDLLQERMKKPKIDSEVFESKMLKMLHYIVDK